MFALWRALTAGGVIVACCVGVLGAADVPEPEPTVGDTVVNEPDPPFAGVDLVMTALTGPTVAAVGHTITVANRVRNQGTSAAGPFRIDFYLSPDPVINPGTDQRVGRRALTGLGAGASSATTTILSIPTGVPFGTYYVGAVVDAGATVAETVETNNRRLMANTVRVVPFRPDLLMSALTAPSTGAVGRPLAVANTVFNQGPAGATAGTFRIDFYLSTDTVITPGTDRLVGSRTVTSLAAGTGSAATTIVTIPANLAARTYYVGAVSDGGAAVVEIAEGNNARRTPSQVTITPFRPDLVMSALTGPATATTGGPIAIANTVRNDGPAGATAGAFRIDFYLSADTTITPGTDRLLGSRTVSTLAAGAISAATTTLTVPTNLAAGAYYVGAVADAAAAVVEINEGNNRRRAAAATTVTVGRATLTVARTGSGGGTVTSTPAGIACGSDCVQSYPLGTTVRLAAAAAAGSVFSGWSGGGCAGSAPCVVTTNVNKTVTATFTPGTGGIVITSLGATSLPPARLLTITGPAFNTSARLSAVFSGNSRSVEIPAIKTSTSSVVVAVPPFVELDTSQMVAGNVNVQVIEDNGTTVRFSNALGFRILAGPTTPLPPGRLTLEFLQAVRSEGLALKTELTDPVLISALNRHTDHLALLIARVQAVVDQPGATFNLGTIDGTALAIGAAELRQMDQMILAMLQALAQPPASGTADVAGGAATGCMQSEAAAAALAAHEGDDNTDIYLRQWVHAPRASATCRTASAINTGFAVVAASGAIGIGIVAVTAGVVGAPVGLALALPTAALLYVTIALGGGEIAIGGALGQTTAGAGQLVQQGVDRLNGVLEDLASTVIPHAESPWLDIARGIGDLSDAFTTSPLPPPAPPPPIPVVTGIVFTGTGSTTSAVITPAIGGVSVSYSVVGTDGYTQSGTVVTNAAGGIAFGIPPGAPGVVDTIVVTVVGGPGAATTHVW